MELTANHFHVALLEFQIDAVLVGFDQFLFVFFRQFQMEGLFDDVKQLEEHPILVKCRHIPFAGLIYIVATFPSDLCR